MAVAVLPLVLVSDADMVWLQYPLLVLQSVIEVFFAPAEQAFIPRLVPEDELVTVNALTPRSDRSPDWSARASVVWPPPPVASRPWRFSTR